VNVGFGVRGSQPVPAAKEPAAKEPAVEEPAEAYDPSDYNVPEVLDYIEEHPDERDAILAAESAGKGRTSILDHHFH
jgi:hypothetical protein